MSQEHAQDHMLAQFRDIDAFYRAMFEDSPFPLGLHKLDGEFVDVNRKWTEVTGIPHDKAIGRTPAELGLVDQATLEEIAEAVIRSGRRVDQVELTYTTQSGEHRYGLLSTGPVQIGDQHLALSILNDVTALRRTEESYRELVQTAGSIIVRWGCDGRILFMNDFGKAFFGYTDEEVIGRNVMDNIVPPTDSSGHDLAQMIDEILADPMCHGTNVNENIRKNGERVWVAWTNKPMYDAHGQVTEILSVGLDVTDRKRTEDALQESERRYKSIFNSNVDAFVLLDLSGTIVDANDRAASLYGYTRDEFIGLSAKDLVDPEHLQLFEYFLSTNLNEWFSAESVDMRRDGTRFDVEVHGTRLRYGPDERLLAIIFDVTERNRARELMKLFTEVARRMQTGLYIYHLENLDDDRTLRLTAANPAASQELGLREEEIIGKYIDEIFPALRARGITSRFADIVRTCSQFSIDDFAYSDVSFPSLIPTRHYSFRAFCIPGQRVGVLFEDITNIVQAEEEKKQFYRKTIEAATEGKLIISDREEIERIVGPAVVTCQIAQSEEMQDVRRKVADAAERAGMDRERVFDLVLCAGEAITNAIKHAQGGTVSVHCKADRIIVVVDDCGSGIQAINLPNVALKRGYTTAVSLGMGYKEMISLADQVYLATGPSGTTIGIEMLLHAREILPSPFTLPDTW